MNNQPESERLFDDVLNDAASPEFRASLLDGTLRQVRRRKHIRRWSRGVVVAAVVLAAVSFAFWRTSPRVSQRADLRKPDLIIVHSRPLDPSMVVQTKPGELSVVASMSSGFAVVETGTTRSILQELDDDGLLRLLQGKAVALVKHGPNQAELIFLNPEDEKGFPIQ